LQLFHARWVLPISRPPIADGTVGIEGARIAWIGPRALAPPGDSTDLGACALLPGLVNAHTHLDLTAMRGLLEGLPFFSWVRTLTRARREVLSEADLLDSARLGIREGLLAGVTTYADTSPSNAAMEAMLEMAVRGIAYREVFGPDPAQVAGAMEELRTSTVAMRARETDLVRVGISPHAPYSVSDELFRACAAFAKEEGLPLATHIAESDDESTLVETGEGPFADFLRGRGIEVSGRARSPVELLEACGVLDTDPLLIHCIHTDGRDIATIGRRRLGVAHCPASNAKLAHRVAPVTELLAAGARVGLGSDSMASNDRMDILREGRLAVESQRTHGRGGLTTADALELATLGGARALGLERDIGSLDVGKHADIAAFPLAPPGASGDTGQSGVMSEAIQPAEELVTSGTALRPVIVMIAGRIVVRDGSLVSPDDRVANRVREAAARLHQWKR